MLLYFMLLSYKINSKLRSISQFDNNLFPFLENPVTIATKHHCAAVHFGILF
jgi:hypothetical protein